ncbi:S-layer homology domain-containing protein [Flintibacter sp. KGMB00164]|uniref:S-layer homology domain-containing protein n=1 Tax=Flintibacter sp. KGMB00164 TaxID=2610895 RepID=UPI00124715B0|nr:S-layer homology domain-containing protein [Flintibacter sp. KGMB00164]
MRNLKRALSLLLSSTMVLGMLVMGSSAAGYKDVDASNDHQEAIEVLQAVGIMTGDQNGNFNPDGSITRNEMAVIMAHLLNLDYDYYRGTNPFTDVPEWAAPYVAACAAEGVVAGIGNGQYGGNNKVTAAEASLMIMKALGYFENAEDFGTDWKVATIRQASYIELFKNINANAESALTRGQVAQLVLNGLKSDMVSFTGDKGIQIGDVTVGYRAEYTVRTSSEKKYDSLVGTTTDIASKDKYTIQLGEELYNGKLTEKADRDAFERPATTWRYDYKVIGTYMNDPDLTYTSAVELGDIYSDLGLSKSKTTDEIYVDGKDTTDVTLAKKDTTEIGANGVLTQVWYDEWMDSNGISKSELIITHVNTYVAKVNAVNKQTSNADRSVTLNALTRPASSLNTKFETEEFEVKDLVAYTAAWNGTRYDIQTVDALELTTTGTLTEWKGGNIYVPGEKGTSNANFTVDSTNYKYSANYYIADEDGARINISDFTVNESEINVYEDAYGYAIYVDGVESPKNYAAVLGVGSSNQYGDETKGVTLLLPDGTMKTVTAKMDNWSDLTNATVSPYNMVTDPVADIVTYVEGDDGVYKLTLAGSEFPAGTVTGKYNSTAYNGRNEVIFENGKSEFKLDRSADNTLDRTLYTTSETIFMVATPKAGGGQNYNVYVGYNNMPGIDPTIPTTGISYVTNSYYTNQIDVVYISTSQLAGIAGVDTFFLKDGSNIITDSNGKYYVFPAIVDGEETTIKIDAETVADWDKNNIVASGEQLVGAAKGMYAIDNVTVNSKGIITGCAVKNNTYFNVANGATGTVAANEVVLGIGKLTDPAQYYAYNKDTKVYYVSEDFKSISVSSVEAVTTDTTDLVYASYDTNRKVLTDVVIVEVPDHTTPTYTVAFTGANFTASKLDGTYWALSNAVKEDTEFKFTLAASAGFAIKSVKVDGVVITPDANGVYTVAVNGNKTIAVETSAIITLTFETASADSAMISINGGEYKLVDNGSNKPTVSVAAGSTVTLQILPASGKTVGSVTSAGNFVSGTGNTQTIIANTTGNVTITYAP